MRVAAEEGVVAVEAAVSVHRLVVATQLQQGGVHRGDVERARAVRRRGGGRGGGGHVQSVGHRRGVELAAVYGLKGVEVFIKRSVLQGLCGIELGLSLLHAQAV